MDNVGGWIRLEASRRFQIAKLGDKIAKNRNLWKKSFKIAKIASKLLKKAWLMVKKAHKAPYPKFAQF